jgi:hypothetical protein
MHRSKSSSHAGAAEDRGAGVARPDADRAGDSGSGGLSAGTRAITASTHILLVRKNTSM